MDHLSDKEMLELMGTPATDRPQIWQDHLDQCESCRQRFEPLEQVWNELGCWYVSTPKRDLTQQILERITQIPRVRLWDTQSLLRIAASIIIGLAVGYWAATRSMPAMSTQTDSQATEASSHLKGFGLESATGWSESFLVASNEGHR